MIITKLKVTNLHAINVAELRFQPGFNLIVGVNGVGKTSILDALSACLSAITKQANNLHCRPKTFKSEDIRVGAGALTIECSVRINEDFFDYLIHQPNMMNLDNDEKTDESRKKIIKKSKKANFLGRKPAITTGKELGGRPLALLFSTNRAVPTQRISRTKYAAEGFSLAFVDAFANRELRLGDFTNWMDVQIALQKEQHPTAQPILDACESAVKRFLPGYQNLHLRGEKRKQLWIDHNEKPIPVRQLSDGERGVLALVLDLTRRLAQANSEMKDPAAEAEAVVLIDEIDLHLHPKWQKDIVRNLYAAFPKCQFIATTHSPLVVGTVEHERIHIFSNGEIYSPLYSYGIDSDRILEEIMETDPRESEVKGLLKTISQTISDHNFNDARDLLTQIVAKLGDNDPEVTRLRTLLEFLEDET